MIRGVSGLFACVLVASTGLLAGCGGSGDAAAPARPASIPSAGAASGSHAELGAVKDYVMVHTALLTGFTAEFASGAQEYLDLANGAGFDYEVLWRDSADEVGPLVIGLKELWIDGNPYYERMEGVVAGTPSLAVAAERWRMRRRRRILGSAVRPAGPDIERGPERVESPA